MTKSTYSTPCPFVLCLAAVLVLSTSCVTGQSENYLLHAYDSAIEMHQQFEQYVDSFRASLNVEAADFGLYFTDALATAIGEASTEAEGTSLQSCAAVAAEKTRTAIELFIEPLEELQAESITLHQSVFQQLIETNVKEIDMELFYYYHNYRMEDSYNRLYGFLLVRLYDDLYSLWDKYFVILEEMEECIEVALE